jgi:hypothetical protein
LGFKTGFRQYVSDSRDKSFIPKLDGGNVDGQRHHGQAGLMPSASLRAGFAERPTADLDDKTAFFRDGDELVGTDESLFGLLPTYEGFDSGNLRGREVHPGLIMQDELSLLQSALQTGFQSSARYGLHIHFRGKELEIAATAFFGVVHGHVGILD